MYFFKVERFTGDFPWHDWHRLTCRLSTCRLFVRVKVCSLCLSMPLGFEPLPWEPSDTPHCLCGVKPSIVVPGDQETGHSPPIPPPHFRLSPRPIVDPHFHLPTDGQSWLLISIFPPQPITAGLRIFPPEAASSPLVNIKRWAVAGKLILFYTYFILLTS